MRQWNDITAIVNGEFLVIIEAKTSSKKHSEQLDKYKEIATNHCTEKQVARALFSHSLNKPILCGGVIKISQKNKRKII
jgi:hypothetical protein